MSGSSRPLYRSWRSNPPSISEPTSSRSPRPSSACNPPARTSPIRSNCPTATCARASVCARKGRLIVDTIDLHRLVGSLLNAFTTFINVAELHRGVMASRVAGTITLSRRDGIRPAGNRSKRRDLSWIRWVPSHRIHGRAPRKHLPNLCEYLGIGKPTKDQLHCQLLDIGRSRNRNHRSRGPRNDLSVLTHPP